MKKFEFDPKKVKAGDSLGIADPEFLKRMRHFTDMHRSLDDAQRRLLVERSAIYSMINDNWREVIDAEDMDALHQRGLMVRISLDNGKLLISGKEIDREKVGVSYG